jgi:threonine aldolase
MIGGGLRQAGVISAAARIGVEEVFLGGKLKQSHDNARAIAKVWTEAGGKLQMPVETNMVWLDIEAARLDMDSFIAMAAERGLRTLGGRLVVHYQISQEAIDRFRLLTQDVLVEKKRGVDKSQAEKLKVEVE